MAGNGGNGSGLPVMRITRVKGKNFICLKDVDLLVTSKLTQIFGKNTHGKTSMLTLIEAVMQGMDPSMVRHGEEKAEGTLEIDDGALVIERTQKITGQGTCKILAPFEMPDGKKKMRPLPVPTQEYLKGLVSANAFRPLDLLILKGKERADYFRKIFKTTLTADMLKGVVEQEDIDKMDFSKDGMQIIEDLAGSKGILYTRRAEINKTLKQKEALLQQKKSELGDFDITQYKDLTDKLESDIQGVQAELSDARAKKQSAESGQRIIDRENATITEATYILQGIDDSTIAEIPALRTAISTITEEITKLQVFLKEKEAILKFALEMEVTRTRAIQAIKTSEDTIKAITVEVPDIAPIEARLNTLQEMKVFNREQKENAIKAGAISTLASDVNNTKTQADNISDTIDTLRKEITQKIVTEAAIPVKDLRIVGDNILVGDKNIDLMSTREQVTVVIQIVEWMNEGKPLKVVCLDRAEVLDDESLVALAEAIPEGYRFFLSEVYHEGQKLPEDAIVMEGGEIKK